MKVFIIPLLAAVAAAQPQFYINGYNGIPSVVSPIATNPLVYTSPVAVAKPVQTMEYEKMDKQVVKEEQEQPMSVQTYAVPTAYGQQIVYKTPVLKQKVGIPARFHIKNGELEHTSFTKREAEPVFPYYNNLAMTYGASPISAISPVAPAVVPYTTPLALQAPVAYKAPIAVTYQTPAVVQQEVEYLKPKVNEQAKTVANDAITPFMYAGKGTTRHENAGAVHIAKREAEPFYGVLPYNTAAGYRTVMPYAATYGNILPYAAPIAPVVSVKTFSDDRAKPEGYAAKGQYHAENAGAIHIAKREAEADPLTILPYTSPVYQRPIISASPFVNSYSFVRSTPFVRTFF